MLNDIFKNEILKNNNRLLVSESIKESIDFEENNSFNIKNLNLCIDNQKGLPVLSLIKKKSKIKVIIHADKDLLNSVILESYKNISINLLEKTLLSFNKSDYFLNYKINCHDNNNYLLELILRRKENGI